MSRQAVLIMGAADLDQLGPLADWAELLNGPLKLFGCKLAFAALRSSAQLTATLVNEAPRKSSMHVGVPPCASRSTTYRRRELKRGRVSYLRA